MIINITKIINSIKFKLLSKRFFAFIISFVILFVSVSFSYFSVPVKADVFSTLEGAIQSLIDFDGIIGTEQGVTQKAINDLFHGVLPATGVIIDPIKFGQYQLNKPIAQYLNRKYGNNDKTADNITDSDISEYARDLNANLTINNNNSIQFNDTSRQMFIDVVSDYVLNEQAYIYSYDGGSSAEYFTSAIFYVRLMSFLRQYQDEYYCLCVLRADTKGQIWCIKKDRYPYLCMVDDNVFRYPNMIKCTPVDGLTAQRIYDADLYFTWDSSDNTFKAAENKAMDYIPYLTLDPSQGFNLSTSSTAWTRGVIMTSGGVAPFRHFKTLSGITAQSVLYQPYYYNNNVYSNFVNSTGDYVVNEDNSNKVSYGDITSYIDSFNTENGYPPNPSQIEIHIHNESNPNTPTPTPNPDNPSGGGSGSFVNNNNPSLTNNPTFNNNPNINITLFPSVSDNCLNGGTVSGNGGQGSIGNIFDWLGNLGNIIASLVKNVGEMIVNALQGVVEAVTTILSDIPNILTPMIEFVFGGLPDEIKALITLGITCIIFVGIIKALKR